MDGIRKIDRQIELELTASQIYRALEGACPDEEVKGLWHTLSVHEGYHAAALEHLKQTLTPAELEKEASTLDMANIEALLSEHRAFLEEIPRGITVHRAFEIAIFMEFSELNSLYFNAVRKGEKEEDSSPYLHSMGAGTRSHLLTLYRGIKAHGGEMDQVPYEEKFIALGLIDAP